MPVSLESAQTLAIGAFNPHIITPQWLIKQGVCAAADFQIRFFPPRQGLAFSLNETQWQIDFDSLSVDSRRHNCGELLGRVIELLPHTPIRAVGNNFHYAASRESWDTCPLPVPGLDKGLDQFGMVDERRWSTVIRNESVRIEVTVAESESAMAAQFNFHRETASAEQARQAAHHFEQDRRISEEILVQGYGQKVAQ